MKSKITLLMLIILPLLRVYAQTITAVATPSTCANNGTITLTPTGIPEPITYGIVKAPYNVSDEITTSTSPIFTMLIPGDYYYGYLNGSVFIPSATTVKVTNQYNTTSPTFTTYYAYNYAYCGSTDPLGTIFAQVTGGNKTYLVELLNSSNVVVQQIQTTDTSTGSTSVTFNSVPAGTYTIRATDACGTLVTAPNSMILKPNVPYTDFTLATVNSQPSASFFNVVYNTPDDICSGIKSASVGFIFSVLGLSMTDVTTPGGGAPTFYGSKNPIYKLEIQNASGGFDVYDNLTATQISSGNYPLPNDRSKWGLMKVSVTLCGITKTNQLDLAQYNQFKILPFTFVSFTIYDDSTPPACVVPSQVEMATNLYQSGGCPPITLDVTENGTSNTQHYELPFNFRFKLDIGKSYTIVAKDATGAQLPSYFFRNSTTSPSTKPSQSDPNNLYIDPIYFTPLAIKDKIIMVDGPSSKNIGKSALVISGLTTALGLVAPINVQTISGPSVINTNLTPTSTSYYTGLGNNLIPGTYKIRITDAQCFSADYDVVLGSYFVSVVLQNVTSEPSPTICDRYVKKGQIRITAVGKTLSGNPDIITTVYGSDYVYPRILNAPTGATAFNDNSNTNFRLYGDTTISFSFAADLSGNYELGLSRKNDYRLLLPSEKFENTTTVPITVLPNFPAFDLSQSGGIICPGNTTGNLTVKVNNATGTVTYFIKSDTDADFPATGQASPVFTGKTAGTYVVKAKSSCFEIVQTFVLKSASNLGDIIVGDNILCAGSSLHLSTVPVGPYTSIVWTLPNNSTIATPVLNIDNVTAANSGQYKVVINTTAGCAINASIIVSIDPNAEVATPVFNALSPALLCQSTVAQQSDYTATATNSTSITYSIAPPGAGTIGAGSQPAEVTWNPLFHGTATITTTASSGCGANKSTDFIVHINPRSDTTSILAEGRTICPNETGIVLNAIAPTISNPVFTWYDSDLISATILGTNDNLTVSPASTTTYYVGVEGDDICTNEAGNRKAVTVTVNPVATISDITAVNQTICSGETATLTATSTLTNPVFAWYTDPDLENSISNIETVNVHPTSTTTYYVTVAADGVCTIPPPAKPVVVTVNSLPIAAIEYVNTSYCNRGTAAVTLTGITGGIFSGDAGLVINATTGEIDLTLSSVGNHTVTYSFSDGTCPNVTTTTININATIFPPTLADVTAECFATPTTPVLTDVCAGTISATTNTVFPITTQGTTVVTWTFNYGNGYTQTADQNVIIKDIATPIVPVLADVSAECSVASITPPTTTDNCSGTITGTTTTVFPITTQGTTIVTWKFDDGNGNIIRADQNVIIKDITAPIVPVLADVTAECFVASITPPTTTDNCAGTITGTTATVFPITTQGTTVVTWKFDDGNGNIITADQNVIIKDITAPIVPVLADVTAECSVTSITPPTTTDNCVGTITGTNTTVFPITTQGTTVVTWKFDDGNGNTTTADQNVIIKDITAPIVPVLADVSAECSVASITPPTTTDNCSGTITGTTTTVFPITTQGTTVVTWKFDDGNGNIIRADQNVIIKDITAPIVPVLADVTAECSVASITPPTTTDNCSGTITGTTATVFPITTQGTTIVTWKFDDGNGNIITADQNVIIKDITAPIVPVLADVSAECSVASITPPTTTDNCAGTITGTTTTVFPITTQGTTIVTWKFDDGNGNIITAAQNIIIKDITAPIVPVLADVTAECSVASITPPTTTDNCSGTITGTTTTVFSITTQGTTIVTWKFDDGNGNITTADQNVIIKDITAPIVPVLADVTAECSVASITPPTTTDNCAGTITGTTTTVFPITTQGTTIVTWKFDDGNGNITTADQNVIIKDITAPIVPVFVDVTGECSVTLTAPTTTDNCSGIITGTTTTQFPITAAGTTMVTWIFNDGNGNIATANQNVIINTIVLTEAEITTCLINKSEYTVTLSVSGQAPYTATGTGAPGTWSGNIWTSGTISSNTNYNVNIQDKYACNTINVSGVAPNCCVFSVICPTFTPTTVSCYDQLPKATNLTIAEFKTLGKGNGNITNTCGVIEITAFNSPDQGCNASITRTYTITEYEDANNNGKHDIGETTILNSAVCTQIINVHDTIAPVFTETLPEAIINTDCQTIPEAMILTATDNCSTAVVNYTETKEEGDCSSRYSLMRTWVASDSCGNENKFVQTINVSCLPNIYNAISPNSDGLNDTFKIEGIDCFPNNTVKIYNRYGVVVYEKKGYDNITHPFEGLSDGRSTIKKSDKLPTGTYFYTLEYDDNGKKVSKSGYLYVSNQ
ncbi:gliding motility-associated C-terminal domain-containing protein [Flavobacterium chilense]|uniref:Gliding motility-associated C-terminal domain-containing protein n=2 Tax=Flavobacterium chilense TaxID=946677 RepID=A0A1M7M0V9_9FLAO|nr:gliding motility-associated C-terminal domain-containing protein [Flavobacterium chilense]SHM84155.1 gliding motility-associated C-terminal domain-containing protein [Flavobacterium chilense]